MNIYNIAIKITKIISNPQSILYHSLFFILIFVLTLFDISFNDVMLILTTIVSLEAIYLSLLILLIQHYHEQKLDNHSQKLDNLSTSLKDTIEDRESPESRACRERVSRE
jgi:hypothetical protein